MVKRLTQWRARSDVDAEEALRYWRDEHPALVARVPRILGYVQNHCIVGPDGAQPPYLGVGEVWFESLEEAAAAAALASPEWQAVIDDADTFMDLRSVSAAWAEEHRLL